MTKYHTEITGFPYSLNFLCEDRDDFFSISTPKTIHFSNERFSIKEKIYTKVKKRKTVKRSNYDRVIYLMDCNRVVSRYLNFENHQRIKAEGTSSVISFYLNFPFIG